jgi:LysM repeat protein
MFIRKIQVILSFALIYGIYGCTAYRPAVHPTGSGQPAEDYISRYKDLAISEMKRSGVPASITLAQGMIESDFGRSTLARDANNHFGIKCHSNWSGPTIRHHDDKRNECFRKYRKPEDSFYDHSDFLSAGSRYKFLFELDKTDYKGWARGLKKAGYATNPDYANMLIRKIEENRLWYFDKSSTASSYSPWSEMPVSESSKEMIVSPPAKPKANLQSNTVVVAREFRVKENNRIQYLVVKDGETKQQLEEQFSLLRWELAKYNELNSDFVPVPGQVLYLQPKRDKAEYGKETHIAVEGESMYQISQLYGVKVKSLYQMNRMEENSELEAGTTIWLRKIKPVN